MAEPILISSYMVGEFNAQIDYASRETTTRVVERLMHVKEKGRTEGAARSRKTRWDIPSKVHRRCKARMVSASVSRKTSGEIPSKAHRRLDARLAASLLASNNKGGDSQ